jgi:hypothetical protein
VNKELTLADEVEHLVLAVGRVHEVSTRANVLAVRVAGHKLEGKSVTRCRDTVGARVVSAICKALSDKRLQE